jgi:hypothetical protein
MEKLFNREGYTVPTSDTRRITLVETPVMSHKGGNKGDIVTTASEAYSQHHYSIMVDQVMMVSVKLLKCQVLR